MRKNIQTGPNYRYFLSLQFVVDFINSLIEINTLQLGSVLSYKVMTNFIIQFLSFSLCEIRSIFKSSFHCHHKILINKTLSVNIKDDQTNLNNIMLSVVSKTYNQVLIYSNAFLKGSFFAFYFEHYTCHSLSPFLPLSFMHKEMNFIIFQQVQKIQQIPKVFS